MNKREKIIAAIMMIVIIIWIRNFMSGPSRKPSLKARTAAPSRTKAPAERQKEPKETETFDWASVVAYGHLKYEDAQSAPVRDPFAVLDYHRVFSNNALDFEELSLTGVIWEREAPVVLINNQILRVGETISGFRVEEIRQNEVVLIKGTDTFILRLYNQDIVE